MKPRSEKSLELYDMLCRRGYEKEFAELVTRNLNTDFTAMRMIGYLAYYDELPMEEVVDEMLSILSDRKRIMEKMEAEKANAAWNEFLRYGFTSEDEEE